MRRSAVAVLVLVPLLVAAARDPRGDVTSCDVGAAVADPSADLVSVDAFADELGTAAVWRLHFAEPVPVPDRAGAPLRIDVLIRDPRLPAMSVGDEHGMNRIVRWDDTASDRPLEVVWLDHAAHVSFNPPVIEGRTIELRVPGRILLGEAENGTESVRRARWSVVVHDGAACDRLGDRPMLRLRELPSSTPTGPSSPASIHTVYGGLGPFALGAIAAAAALVVALAIAAVWRRRTT